MVFADQAVTQGSGQPNLDRSRLQFHLVKNSGRWLVDKFAIM
ncbi:hypothetical protein [Mycobacterium talmoniae]|nr:hypothetical protein [Mycobacterium talmoniae]